MPKFIVMLRIKDGMFWLQEWLDCYEQLADEIVVLDNGSTDGTYERIRTHPKVSSIIRTTGYNEGRDKNLLYKEVRKRRPDWCLWIDVDEIFESSFTRAKLNKLMKSNRVNKYSFRRFHFIDKEHFAGSDFRLNYSSGHDRIMWRESPTGYFENFIVDSPNVKGIKGITWPTHFRLKHLGYINKDMVDKKADIYRQIIPEKENILQEMYMRNEKAVKWIDDMNHADVKKLNRRLDLILLKNYARKLVRLVTGKFKKEQPEGIPGKIEITTSITEDAAFPKS